MILSRNGIRLSSFSMIKVMGKGKAKHGKKMLIDFAMEDFSSDEESVVFGSSYPFSSYSRISGICHARKGSDRIQEHIPLKPRNQSQKMYIEKMSLANQPPIVVSVGPAGTGKTLLATHVGMQMLQENKIRKLIVTRPAVSVDEEHGFLPGTLEEKMAPWTRPIFDVFYEYFPSRTIKQMIEQQVIEICPLAYMRGRTFANSWIIADEMQNATPNQMLMLLTRIGTDSKLIITGDLAQYERGFEHNGLKDLVHKLNHTASTDNDASHHIYLHRFHSGDIERHPVIAHILNLYDPSKDKTQNHITTI